jgi:hypothetical protein
LGLWAAPNVGAERLIQWLNVKGIDEVILRCMQVLFGASTLAPICISIYKDVRVMWVRANQQITVAGEPRMDPPLNRVNPATDQDVA